MSIQLIFLFFIIPLLFIFLSFYVYSFYIKINQKKLMVDVLANTNAKILNNDKKEKIDTNTNNFLEKKLQYAGFIQKGAIYIFVLISFVFSFFISSFIFIIVKSITISLICFFIFIFIPYLVLIKIIKVREEEFNYALKEMIDKLTSMMKSGVGFEQAFKKSILSSKSVLTKNIFSIYINEKSVLGEDKCFEKMFKLIESKELRIFYLTITIGRKSGGKFSNTLEKLRKTLHDQGEIKQEITSSTKEIKVGTYMIVALIIFTYIMMNNALNDSLNAHFFGSDIGKLQMFFIILWIAFGLFINSLLTKIK